MSPVDYERVVKALLQADFEGVEAQSFHLKKYTGKSGQRYEIDVSFEVRIGVFDIVILVECKRHARSITVQEIADFAFRLRDIGAHKGVMVSSNGFQRGVIKVARAEKIALLMVGDAIEMKPPKGVTVLHSKTPSNDSWFSGLGFTVKRGDTDDVALRFHTDLTGEEVVSLGGYPSIVYGQITRAPCFLVVRENAILFLLRKLLHLR